MTLHEKAEILSLKSSADGHAFFWEPTSSVWLKGEIQSKSNLFSKIGIGARSVNFEMFRRELTMHQAIQWNGRFCFISNIIKNGVYLNVSAALVEPVECTYKEKKYKRGNLNRPEEIEPEIVTFPGILTEKYLGHEKDVPRAVNELEHVLVTPKPIEMKPGKIVIVGEKPYTVTICHTLDEYKNEYEIRREADT